MKPLGECRSGGAIRGIPAVRSRWGPQQRLPVQTPRRQGVLLRRSPRLAARTENESAHRPARASNPANGSAGTAGRPRSPSPGSSAPARPHRADGDHASPPFASRRRPGPRGFPELRRAFGLPVRGRRGSSRAVLGQGRRPLRAPGGGAGRAGAFHRSRPAAGDRTAPAGLLVARCTRVRLGAVRATPSRRPPPRPPYAPRPRPVPPARGRPACGTAPASGWRVRRGRRAGSRGPPTGWSRRGR